MHKDAENNHPLTKFDEYLEKVYAEEEIRTKFKKYIILMLIAMGMSIFYMIYDSLQIFQTIISKNDRLTIWEYELLYTITHLIPIFATPFYGIFTDLYSVRNTYLLCFCAVLFGHLVFTIGLNYGSFFIMFLGRISIGCGYPITATSYAYLSKWFIKIKDVYAFSILSFAARIGSFVVSYLIPTNYVDSHKILIYPLMIPTISLLIFFIGVYVLYYFDVIIDRKIDMEKQDIIISRPKNGINNSLNFDQSEKAGQFFQVFGKNNFNLFERSYWMLVLASGIIFLTIFTFFNRLTDLLIVRYNFNEEKALKISGFSYIITAVFTPIFGVLVTMFEKRVKFLLIATVFNIIAHFFFTFFIIENHLIILYTAIFLKSLAFACIPTAHYSSFVILVPQNRIGRAYGFNSMVESISVTCGFLLSALLVQDNMVGDIINKDKYVKIDFICFVLSIFSFFVYITLKKLKV